MEDRAAIDIPTKLIEGLRAGNGGGGSALEEIMQAYFDRIARFAYTIVKSRSEAEDVAQEVFVRLWNVREKLDPSRSVKSFLFQSAKNIALDRIKHLKVEERYSPDVSTPQNSEQTLITTIAVQSAIDQLPERRGLAVRLRYQEQMSYAEIGVVLEISAKAAEQLVIRGVAELKKVFLPGSEEGV